jgi:hypothetical protein
MKQTIEHIKISNLYLWTENPRDPLNIDNSYSDLDVMRRAIDENPRKWNLSNLIKEMGDYYDTSELPTVVEKNGKYVVYDGNRRISIIKYLQNPEWSVQLENKLFPTQTSLLSKITSLPCNVCDEETALNNIERKHINNSSWGQLERDYFQYIHRNAEKTLFIKFEEATGLISANPKLNERIFKENILTKYNLNQIGFDFDNDILISNYDKKTAIKILDKLVELRNNQTISSRDGQYKKYEIKKPIEDNLDNDIITKFAEDGSASVNYPINSLGEEEWGNNAINSNLKRKTRRNNTNNEVLFGEKLYLKEGDVNNLYSILDDLFVKHKNDRNILPIIGMSLRLIMEVAGREAFPEDFKDKDVVFKDFYAKVKEAKILDQAKQNTLSLDENFNSKNGKNFEAYMGKYAHGMIEYDKTNILNFSKIVGTILKHYFSKE